MPLAPEALAYAKARFDRPSVFGRTCPHVIDALRGEADRCREALQVDRARSLYGDVLARDAHDWAARFGLGIMELRFGDAVVGATGLRELADDEATPLPWRDRSGETLADTLLASADPRLWQKAMESYAELAAHAKDEDVGRTLEVKRYVASRALTEPEGREAVVALLIGSRGRPADAEEGLARVAAWAKGTEDPVAEYVLGKNLLNREFWAEAAEHFDRAIAVGGADGPDRARAPQGARDLRVRAGRSRPGPRRSGARRSEGWPVRGERRAARRGLLATDARCDGIARRRRAHHARGPPDGSVEGAVGVEDGGGVVLPRIAGASGEAVAQRRGRRLVGEESGDDRRPVVRFPDPAVGHRLARRPRAARGCRSQSPARRKRGPR